MLWKIKYVKYFIYSFAIFNVNLCIIFMLETTYFEFS